MLPRVQTGITTHKVEGRALCVFLVPTKGLLVRDFLHVVHASTPGPFLCALPGFSFTQTFRGNTSVLRAPPAQPLGERTGVNALNAGVAFRFQMLREGMISTPGSDHG